MEAISIGLTSKTGGTPEGSAPPDKKEAGPKAGSQILNVAGAAVAQAAALQTSGAFWACSANV